MHAMSVIVAGTAAWVFGAIWYGIAGRTWMEAAGLTDDTINRKNFGAYIGSFVCAILVAGMMRHILASGNTHGIWEGALTGFGLGAFVAAPWLVTNYLFAQRPQILMIIDAGYAIGGCLIIGLVLGAFA